MADKKIEDTWNLTGSREFSARRTRWEGGRTPPLAKICIAHISLCQRCSYLNGCCYLKIIALFYENSLPATVWSIPSTDAIFEVASFEYRQIQPALCKGA